MTCEEFRRVLPYIIDGSQTVEQERHWKSCSACSVLVSDLTFISEQARQLRSFDEPSPRVWNSIELALREQGLVRQPRHEVTVIPSPSRRWSLGWLVPLAATFLLTFGLIDYYSGVSKRQLALTSSPSQVTAGTQPGTLQANAVDAEDELLLEEVAARTPAMRATYEANLQDVNAYIRDAKELADSNPNDEEAQQSLVEAYAQKNMVYEMALAGSLR